MTRTYLRMEILRLARNRRVLIFSVLMPALLLLIFGGINKNDRLGGVTAAAYIMVSMGLFGAMGAATGSGGSIAAVTKPLLIGSINADDANGAPRCPRKNWTTPLTC